MSRSRGRRTLGKDDELLTWRERIARLRYVPRLMRLVWQTHRGFTTAIVVLRLLYSVIPVATLWVGKLIIDTVVAAQNGAVDYARLWRLVALEISIVLAGEILERLARLIEGLLGDLFSNHTSIRLMEHAARLDLYHFEDPNFYDQLERARRQTTSRIMLVSQTLSIGQNILTLASLAAALAVYSPWLLLLLAVSVFPSFLGETRLASMTYSLLYRWTPERRQLDYLRYL
ncbi:MAG TPA: ABC transporter ATP-binding protein, partial [Blastocatellia bacterium]|nr:ABC transporter ATP-binding protein [Blastocatellia bacterium]